MLIRKTRQRITAMMLSAIMAVGMMPVSVAAETGAISIARDGKLVRYIDAKALSNVLESLFLQTGNASAFSWIKRKPTEGSHEHS